jgi:hypothetical protein
MSVMMLHIACDRAGASLGAIWILLPQTDAMPTPEIEKPVSGEDLRGRYKGTRKGGGDSRSGPGDGRRVEGSTTRPVVRSSDRRQPDLSAAAAIVLMRRHFREHRTRLAQRQEKWSDVSPIGRTAREMYHRMAEE